MNTTLLRGANLAVPGGGLVLGGDMVGGVAVGVAFTLAACSAIAVTLLFPDDVSPLWRGVLIGAAGGAYVGAQFRLEVWLVHAIRRARRDRRDAALRAVVEALRVHDVARAREALGPVLDLVEEDLLTAYRAARVFELAGEASAATSAWEHVRRLDRRHIYREARESALRRLGAS